MLSFFLKIFSLGLAAYWGTVFGFGQTADDDTGSLLKISTVSEELMEKLDKVPIHNLVEVVLKLSIMVSKSGKNNLSTVSRNVILNKRLDLSCVAELANIRK